MIQTNGKPFQALDIPIVKLIPRTERKVNKKHKDRIAASLRAVGLIDPLIIYPQGDNYEILDGVIRYRLLLEMGIESVPCLIGNQRESFTGNRMVNQLSPAQEMRMLRKSLEELDEQTIAQALGIAGIKHRLRSDLMKKLDPEIIKIFEAGTLTLQCVKELAHVKQSRQLEILKMMESCKDYSVTFARGLVLKTATAKRAKVNGAKTPWNQTEGKKSDLLKRLREVEEQHDFYSGLYRQYTTNLLKLVIYIRTLVNHANVRSYLNDHHPEQLEIFQQIIEHTEG